MSSHDIYPMPLFPRLTVRDVAASTAFYTDVLGFDEVFAMPGGGMSHVRSRKYADVMLAESGPPVDSGTAADSETLAAPGDDSGAVVGAGVELYLTVEEGSADDVAARVREAGRAADGPTETAWNTREVRVEDPDGYVLVFSERVEDPDPLPWLDAGASVEDGTPNGDERPDASDGETGPGTDRD